MKQLPVETFHRTPLSIFCRRLKLACVVLFTKKVIVTKHNNELKRFEHNVFNFNQADMEKMATQTLISLRIEKERTEKIKALLV